MKKLVSILLVLLLMLGISSPAGAAVFDDIADPAQSAAADVLSALGIMQGWDGDFHPDETLTREQFAKIAVTLMNQEEMAFLWKDYTIYPDVPYHLWSAGYVNAAAKLGLVAGFPDGTFAPSQNVTDAQAITICLRMLDYSVGDIGVRWPENYISKAAEIGLTEGLSISADTPMSRGRAAILINNMLMLTRKGGGAPFIASMGRTTLENAILLATPETDRTLKANQLKIYAGAEKIYETSSSFSKNLVGTSGLFILSSEGKINAYIPYEYRAEKISVEYADAVSITHTSKKVYTFDPEVPFIVRGQMRTLYTAWYDIVTGMTVTVYYGEGDEVVYLWCDPILEGLGPF